MNVTRRMPATWPHRNDKYIRPYQPFKWNVTNGGNTYISIKLRNHYRASALHARGRNF